MKLHPDNLPALNTVTAYGDGFVDINLQRHMDSVIIIPEQAVHSWPVTSFDNLDAAHFTMLLEYGPELVIFGSGAKLRFPHPKLTAALAKHRIGIETMDMQAACRTYNVLMAEGRKVVAALLIEST